MVGSGNRRFVGAGLMRRGCRAPTRQLSSGGGATLPTANLRATFDQVGVTDVSGNASAWADQTVNAYSVVQTSATERPLIVSPDANFNNKQSLLFGRGGDNDYLISTGGTPPATTDGNFTVHAVVNVRALSWSNSAIYGANSGSQQMLVIRNSGGTRYWQFYDGTAYRDTGVAAATGVQVITLVCDATGGACRIYKDGSQLGTDMTYVSNPIGSLFTIGSTVNGNNEWDGWIAELDIYDGAQDATAIAGVLAYYTQEYGTP